MHRKARESVRNGKKIEYRLVNATRRVRAQNVPEARTVKDRILRQVRSQVRVERSFHFLSYFALLSRYLADFYLFIVSVSFVSLH